MLTAQHSYSPFGLSEAFAESGGLDAGFPFRFTGRRLDEETGLYYYRAIYMMRNPDKLMGLRVH